MGVIIDKCPNCGGIFLDAGELEKIKEQSLETGEFFLEI
jgi:Zn-finger nucleic acid-binding protein